MAYVLHLLIPNQCIEHIGLADDLSIENSADKILSFFDGIAVKNDN